MGRGKKFSDFSFDPDLCVRVGDFFFVGFFFKCWGQIVGEQEVEQEKNIVLEKWESNSARFEEKCLSECFHEISV